MRHLRLATFLSPLFVAATIGLPAGAQENIGKVQQPIVAGTLVDNATQRARGLVTVAGGCSGTLINQYWVLTADHCVTTDGRVNGPSAALGNVRISAAWSGTVATPTRLVRNWGGSGRDVALVFLGNGDFGAMPIQLLNFSGLDPGMSVVKFGRGISAYASAGPPPVAATADGRYRTANFTVASVGNPTYTLNANSAGQVGNGGDSGGPDWVVAGNGSLLNIAGVQSTCVATGYVAGQPRNWNWATGVSSCNSASIWDIYHEIVEITRPQYVAFCQDYAAKATAAANDNQSLGCGFGGPRWTTDRLAHLDWCVGLVGDQNPANFEAGERSKALRQCRRDKGLVLADEIARLPTDVMTPKQSDTGRIIDKLPADAILQSPRDSAAGRILDKLPSDVILQTPGAGGGGSPAALIPAPNPAPGVNFSGDWNTVTGNTVYAMTLTQDAAGRVSGTYSSAGSAQHQIAGSVVGNELIAQWTEGGATGIARFALAADGNSFSGGWAGGAAMPAPTQNPWTGTRLASTQTPEPQPPPAAPPVQVGACGPSGGTAVVEIADPNLTKLNVRDAPGGKVLTTIPEGTQVTLVGECGAAGAAGIVAQQDSGWCQIDSPVNGCVAARFLAFGDAGGAAGIVAQGAGIAKPQTTPPPPPPVEAEPAGGLLAVLTQGANLRSEPDSKKKNVIATLPGGSVVGVVECSKSWCRIEAAGIGGGWVSKQFIRITQGGEPPLDIAKAEPPGAPPPLAGQGDGCGLPAGMATVVIPDPNLDKLNVRESPGGRVIATVPEGSQVSVIGECGATLAAGIVAKPQGGGGAPGWCQIDAPVTGCVSARFLAAGGSAPPGGAAGLAAGKPVIAAVEALGFAGTWSTSVDGIPHAVRLDQNGSSVTGSYQGAEGSAGQIAGTATGNVLRFTWSQNDGQTGAGRFTLSGDGQSFKGSYSFSGDPDQVDGNWTGVRQ
jgi:hypothetical protein